MKDEIKEILDFKEDADYKRLSVDEIVILKDYITNLQEENENKDNKILELQQELLNKKLNIKDIEYKEKMIYKSRNEKANEYIKEHTNNFVECLYVEEVEELSNILEGDKDE